MQLFLFVLLLALTSSALANACHDRAALIEAIERTPPEKRERQLRLYRDIADRKTVQLIYQAEAAHRAGLTSAQAWRECPAY